MFLILGRISVCFSDNNRQVDFGGSVLINQFDSQICEMGKSIWRFLLKDHVIDIISCRYFSMSSILKDDDKMKSIKVWVYNQSNVNSINVDVTVEIDGEKLKENAICCQSVVRDKHVVIKIGCHMHN